MGVTLSDPGQPHGIDLQTSHGDIHLSLPANLPASITARVERFGGQADRSDIYSDFPLSRSADGAGGRGLRSTGDINGGGDAVNLQTSGGTIRIKGGS